MLRKSDAAKLRVTDLNVNERCAKVIPQEIMIEYYGKKWETIKS